jgi:hypothetical protein
MLAAVALVTLASGCVSGHLFAAGRRREYARSIHAVTPTAGATIVDYTADVTDDDGDVIDSLERTTRLPGERNQVALRDLTRTWTAPWVYPVLPLAIAADAVVFPLLTALAPIVIIVGD